MALQTAAEVEAMIEDTGGDTVVFGGVTTYGHVDYVDEEILEGGELATVARVRTVLITTGILPNLDRDATIVVGGTAQVITDHLDRSTTIVVGGTAYVITDHRVENDGAETRLWLGDNA